MTYYNLLSMHPCDKIYVRKTYVFDKSIFSTKGLLDRHNPPTTESTNYKNWIAIIDLKTCVECRTKHGQIYLINEYIDQEPPLHEHCRCEIKNMEAVAAGLATKDDKRGADWWLKLFGVLPDYYVTRIEAQQAGWRDGKSLARYIHGKMITRGIYNNDDGHLPTSPGRIWREADINYYEGRRNRHRVLWSNDGLIFVTYDHYETFYEII